MTRKRWILLGGALLGVTFFLFDPEPTHRPAPPAAELSAEARRIHREALVVDLHVDSLLWQRSLLERDGGHVDFPRMGEGGLDAAAFTVATEFFGVGGLKAFHDLWPPRTWVSPWERFNHQIRKMDAFIEASEGRVRRATRASEIRANQKNGVISVFHGIEGAHALGEDVSRVAAAAGRGVLFIGPVHLSDNAFGGSSSGANRGLTPLGRRLISEMNRAGVMVDLAHASQETFDEALSLTTLPPLVSHVGARAIFDTWRNVTDEQIRAVAAHGGVLGVMLTPPALRAPDLEEAMRHLAHMVSVGGEDAVALGSDFDGYVTSPIDVTGLPELTELMLREGWSETRIRKILGENFLRVLEGQSMARREASQAGAMSFTDGKSVRE